VRMAHWTHFRQISGRSLSLTPLKSHKPLPSTNLQHRKPLDVTRVTPDII
jgi:hypothetical protein